MLRTSRAEGERSAQGFDVGVVEDEAVGGDDGQVLQPGGGDDEAIGGITVDGIGQGVSFFDDLEGDWNDIPSVAVGLGAEPFLPMLRKRDLLPLLQAGELCRDDGAAVDDLLGRSDELKGGGAEPLGCGGQIKQRAGIEEDHRAPSAPAKMPQSAGGIAGPSKSARILTAGSNPLVERFGREGRGVIFATGLLREQTKMESPD